MTSPKRKIGEDCNVRLFRKCCHSVRKYSRTTFIIDTWQRLGCADIIDGRHIM